MHRPLLTDEHEALRESFGRYLDAEIAQPYPDWEKAGAIPRDVLRRTGSLGFLGLAVEEKYGGAGIADFVFNSVLNEAACARGLTSFALSVTMQNDVALPYLLELCTDEQRDRWLPGVASGDIILAIAMSEPQTGSDLQGIRTRATRSGDSYIVTGSKTFVTSGINADLVITAVRTGSAGTHADISLVMVEADAPGFERGRKLAKLGHHAQDTAELFFEDARVPVENILGNPGDGFRYLTSNLAQERLSIAVGAVASARGAFERALEYARERQAFGRPIGEFQNTRFALAACRTELEVAQAFVDKCLAVHNAGRLSPQEAAMAKLWASEAQGRVVDACLQVYGGYGYMLDYPIARDYADARVTRIFGGTSEIMKEVIARGMGLREPPQNRD
jgi:alkylation response protein AidB-like acyl-CoA dehydrogenase